MAIEPIRIIEIPIGYSYQHVVIPSAQSKRKELIEKLNGHNVLVEARNGSARRGMINYDTGNPREFYLEYTIIYDGQECPIRDKYHLDDLTLLMSEREEIHP